LGKGQAEKHPVHQSALKIHGAVPNFMRPASRTTAPAGQGYGRRDNDQLSRFTECDSEDADSNLCVNTRTLFDLDQRERVA